jgi:hypothetical protein
LCLSLFHAPAAETSSLDPSLNTQLRQLHNAEWGFGALPDQEAVGTELGLCGYQLDLSLTSIILKKVQNTRISHSAYSRSSPAVLKLR